MNRCLKKLFTISISFFTVTGQLTSLSVASEVPHDQQHSRNSIPTSLDGKGLGFADAMVLRLRNKPTEQRLFIGAAAAYKKQKEINGNFNPDHFDKLIEYQKDFLSRVSLPNGNLQFSRLSDKTFDEISHVYGNYLSPVVDIALGYAVMKIPQLSIIDSPLAGAATSYGIHAMVQNVIDQHKMLARGSAYAIGSPDIKYDKTAMDLQVFEAAREIYKYGNSDVNFGKTFDDKFSDSLGVSVFTTHAQLFANDSNYRDSFIEQNTGGNSLQGNDSSFNAKYKLFNGDFSEFKTDEDVKNILLPQIKQSIEEVAKARAQIEDINKKLDAPVTKQEMADLLNERDRLSFESQKKMANVQGSFQVASFIADKIFKDPKGAEAINRIGGATMGILSVQGMGAMAVGGAYLAAFSAIASLSDLGKPSSEQIIMEMIGELSKQIKELRKIVIDGFTHIDKKLTQEFENVNEKLDKLILLGYLNNDLLNEIKSELRLGVTFIVEKIEEQNKAIDLFSIDHKCFNSYFGYAPLTLENLNVSEFRDCLAKLNIKALTMEGWTPSQTLPLPFDTKITVDSIERPFEAQLPQVFSFVDEFKAKRDSEVNEKCKKDYPDRNKNGQCSQNQLSNFSGTKFARPSVFLLRTNQYATLLDTYPHLSSLISKSKDSNPIPSVVNLTERATQYADAFMSLAYKNGKVASNDRELDIDLFQRIQKVYLDRITALATLLDKRSKQELNGNSAYRPGLNADQTFPYKSAGFEDVLDGEPIKKCKGNRNIGVPDSVLRKLYKSQLPPPANPYYGAKKPVLTPEKQKEMEENAYQNWKASNIHANLDRKFPTNLKYPKALQQQIPSQFLWADKLGLGKVTACFRTFMFTNFSDIKHLRHGAQTYSYNYSIEIDFQYQNKSSNGKLENPITIKRIGKSGKITQRGGKVLFGSLFTYNGGPFQALWDGAVLDNSNGAIVQGPHPKTASYQHWYLPKMSDSFVDSKKLPNDVSTSGMKENLPKYTVEFTAKIKKLISLSDRLVKTVSNKGRYDSDYHQIDAMNQFVDFMAASTYLPLMGTFMKTFSPYYYGDGDKVLLRGDDVLKMVFEAGENIAHIKKIATQRSNALIEEYKKLNADKSALNSTAGFQDYFYNRALDLNQIARRLSVMRNKH